MARDVLRALDSDFKSHRIATSVDLAPELPPIMAHKVQLREVITEYVIREIILKDVMFRRKNLARKLSEILCPRMLHSIRFRRRSNKECQRQNLTSFTSETT